MTRSFSSLTPPFKPPRVSVRRPLPLTLLSRLSALLLALGLALQTQAVYANRLVPQEGVSASSIKLKGEVNAFGILTEDLQADLGLRLVNDGKKVLIKQVSLGTEAHYSGLEQGDQVLDARLEGNEVRVTIDRGGKVYSASLRRLKSGDITAARIGGASSGSVPSDNSTTPTGQPLFGSAAQAGQSAQSAQPNNPTQPIQLDAKDEARRQKIALRAAQRGDDVDEQLEEFDAKIAEREARKKQRFELKTGENDYSNTPAKEYALDAKNIRILSRYNLELILDRSLSMKAKDCPGTLSRWDWCGYQAADIAKALAPYVPNGLTITPFAGEWNVYEHATPQNIVDVFAQHNFTLGTRLAEPLTLRLNNFFAQHKPGDKPLLIAVVTDGMPYPSPEPEMVKDELIKASQSIGRPGEVTVVFMQIGGRDPKGREYLLDLGNNLVSYGARSQYVHTRTFDQLVASGLAQALVDAVKQYAPAGAQEATAKGNTAAKTKVTAKAKAVRK